MKISLYLKHDDRVSMIINENDVDVYESCDYLPYVGCLGGDHTELVIDNETGKILNWKPITKEEYEDLMHIEDEDE